MSKWGHLGATFENQLTRRQKTKLNDDVDDNAAPSDDDVADDDDEEDNNKKLVADRLLCAETTE